MRIRLFVFCFLLPLMCVLGNQYSFSQDRHDKIIEKIVENEHFQKYCIEMQSLANLYLEAIMKLNKKEYAQFLRRYDKGGYYYDTTLNGTMSNQEMMEFQRKCHEETEKILDSVHYSGIDAKEKHRKVLHDARDARYHQDTVYMKNYLKISPQEVDKKILNLIYHIKDMGNVFENEYYNFTLSDLEDINVLVKFVKYLNAREITHKNKCMHEFRKYVNIDIANFFIGVQVNLVFFKKDIYQFKKYDIIGLHTTLISLADYYRKCLQK